MSTRDKKSDSKSSPEAKVTSSASVEIYYELTREDLQRTIPELRQCLTALGVTAVYADYDGECDDGYIEEVRCIDAQHHAVSIDAKVNARIKAVLYGLLCLRHQGWEIGQGAEGEFIWSIEKDRLTHNHEPRDPEEAHTGRVGYDA